MTCRELTELLIDYLQGELEADLADDIARHLSQCPPCETFVSTYRITIQLTRHLPAAPMPAELKARLDAALRQHRSGGDEGVGIDS